MTDRRPSIFAVFGEDTALPPSGLMGFNRAMMMDAERRQQHNLAPPAPERAEELKRQCSDKLGDVARHHQEARVLELGDGNGFTFFASPYSHYATRDHVSCLFAGQVAEWPGLDLMAENHNAYVTGVPEDAHDEASWLLTYYDTFRSLSYKGVAEEALQSLAHIKGSFAFVIYDNKIRRVLAARDAGGAQSFYWGSTPDGRLMFASDILDLGECDPTATLFPAGSLYISESKTKAIHPGKFGWVIGGEVIPGEVMSFVPRTVPAPKNPFRTVKAIPRITSKGCLNGAVFRVASESNIISIS